MQIECPACPPSRPGYKHQASEQPMTEATWLGFTNIGTVRDHLEHAIGEWKLRLLACAYCRRVWRKLTPSCREAVEAAERFVDGEITAEDLDRARKQARGQIGIIDMVKRTAYKRTVHASIALVMIADDAAGAISRNERSVPHKLERAWQADVARCIAGNPFRPVALDRSIAAG
jgi:hypothetical protein